jgi:alkanesulfonate monooxygenase SsuD/methylene tetrahydromethanopterin reductase-like flavin-dependent oxidoreductase (luciferase family)
MPLMIGGSGEKLTLRIIAEQADLWHSFGDAERYAHKSEVLAGHCADVGRDPAEIDRVWGVSADDIAGSAEPLYAAGVRFLTVGVGGDGTGYDLGAVRELVQWRDGH